MGCALNAVVLQEAARRTSTAAADAYYARAAKHLTRAIAINDSVPSNSSLYKGTTGLGWAVQIFDEPGRLPWREEFLQYLDFELASALRASDEIELDIVNGFAGIMIYALAREQCAPGYAPMWTVIADKVFQIFSHWMQIIDYGAEASEYRNLGLAHGIPGVISVAAAAAARGLLSPQAVDVVVKSLGRLWELRLPVGNSFSYEVGKSQRARLAWCYGGIGIAAVFRSSVQISSHSMDRFEMICDACMDQYFEHDHGLKDASVCHGHAGVALAFSAFANTKGIEPNRAKRLTDLADRASETALAQEKKSAHGPVFLFSTSSGYREHASFLEGSPGVALALSAGQTPNRSSCLDLLGYF